MVLAQKITRNRWTKDGLYPFPYHEGHIISASSLPASRHLRTSPNLALCHRLAAQTPPWPLPNRLPLVVVTYTEGPSVVALVAPKSFVVTSVPPRAATEPRTSPVDQVDPASGAANPVKPKRQGSRVIQKCEPSVLPLARARGVKTKTVVRHSATM
jgi:hypothetical protein